MKYIGFNHLLLLDLVGQPVEKLKELCPDLSLELFLEYRMMNVQNDKFILTTLGQNMIDFEKRRGKNDSECK